MSYDSNGNGTIKLLKKLLLCLSIIIALIGISTAIVAPYLYHDRAISSLDGKLTTLNTKIDRLQGDVNDLKILVSERVGKSIVPASALFLSNRYYNWAQ